MTEDERRIRKQVMEWWLQPLGWLGRKLKRSWRTESAESMRDALLRTDLTPLLKRHPVEIEVKSPRYFRLVVASPDEANAAADALSELLQEGVSE